MKEFFSPIEIDVITLTDSEVITNATSLPPHMGEDEDI